MDHKNEIFQAIQSGDITKVKSFLSGIHDVDIEDEHGTTLLQTSAFKGSLDLCKLLLDMGADPNGGHHDSNYSTLHFAALSGNPEVCALLLEAGSKPDALNTVNRTPAQMAAFIGNHSCVAVINNYVDKSYVEYYTQVHGQEAEPKLDCSLLNPVHSLVNLVNMHPVKIIQFVNNNSQMKNHLPRIVNVLTLMSEKEMKRGKTTNEILAFKFYYFSQMLDLLINKESSDLTSAKDKFQSPEEYIIRLLLFSVDGVSQYQEGVIREAVKLYPFKETMTFRQLLTSLSEKPTASGTPGYLIVDSVVNGQKGFHDDLYCATCGEMSKTHKKCVKCKAVQYCSKECQKLHWFVHKKECETLRKAGFKTEQNLKNGANQILVK